MQTSILYVCTFWGARSRIAEVFTKALNIPGLRADSAGFESGRIGEAPRRVLAERGLYLPEASPETLFTRFRTGSVYDHIVILANDRTQENYSVLRDTVTTLFGHSARIDHWPVADFMAITAEGNARVRAVRNIVNDIEGRVLNLINELESASMAWTAPPVMNTALEAAARI